MTTRQRNKQRKLEKDSNKKHAPWPLVHADICALNSGWGKLVNACNQLEDNIIKGSSYKELRESAHLVQEEAQLTLESAQFVVETVELLKPRS